MCTIKDWRKADFSNSLTLFSICAFLSTLATATPRSKLTSSYPKRRARVGGGAEASRCWNVADNGSPFQLRSHHCRARSPLRNYRRAEKGYYQMCL